MTKQEIEEKLLGAVAELREATSELQKYAKDAATSDHAYRRSKAVAYLASSGTVAERSAHVDKACETEREKAHTSEALREAVREKVRALQTEIMAYQTLASLFKTEMSLEGRYS